MTCGVYCYIDNVKDEIVYVGASKNCEERNKTHYHLSNMKKQYINYVLQNDIDNRYSFLILLKCQAKDIWDKEKAFIDLISPEYNFKSLKDLHITSTPNIKCSNSTGLFHVTKSKTSWVYRMANNGQRFECTRSSLRELEYIVKKEGYPWFIIDKDLADKNYYISDKKKGHTLYYNVRQKKADNRFGYVYYYRTKDIYLSSMYIEELEYKVKSHGLEWRSFI